MEPPLIPRHSGLAWQNGALGSEVVSDIGAAPALRKLERVSLPAIRERIGLVNIYTRLDEQLRAA